MLVTFIIIIIIINSRHSNPPDVVESLPIWRVASRSPYFYQVLQINHKIPITKKKLLILEVFLRSVFLWLPTECIYALWTVSLQLFTIFQSGHLKVVKEISLFDSEKMDWQQQRKLKDICDKDNDLI